jgi:Leucine-rich repeat (LRR) protein
MPASQSVRPRCRVLLPALLLLPLSASAKIDFTKEVWPLIEKSCLDCHRAPYQEDGKLKKPKGNLRLDAAWAMLQGGEGGKIIVPGDPAGSELLKRTLLPEDDDDFMPPKGTTWTSVQKDLVAKWISEGADFGGWEGNKDGQPLAKAPAPSAPVSWIQTHYDALLKNLAPAPEADLGKVTAAGGRVAPLAASSPLLAVDFLVTRDQATDEKIASITAVKNQLTHLDISRSAVTDSGLAPLKGLPRLTRLDLHGTKITDAGLNHLAGLPNLTYLNLYDTGVSDAGIPEIAKLKALRSVYLWKTSVTEKGAKALEKALPKAQVVWK